MARAGVPEDGTALQGIRYDELVDESDSHAESPRRLEEFDEDASWSWEADRERQGLQEASAITPDDRQSGAASPANNSILKAAQWAPCLLNVTTPI